ncbi:MAG: hypothetical protein ACI9LG_002882, partial [Moritella dasanensis]
GSESSAAGPTVSDSQPGEILVEPIQTPPALTVFSLEEIKPRVSGIVIESTAKTSGEIAVPDGFSLSSERTFNLKITRTEDDNQAAYLSLCSDYQHHSDGSYSINYDSCLLRTSLNDYNYEAVITVTNDTVGLVAVLWFLDESKEQIITDWLF